MLRFAIALVAVFSTFAVACRCDAQYPDMIGGSGGLCDGLPCDAPPPEYRLPRPIAPPCPGTQPPSCQPPNCPCNPPTKQVRVVEHPPAEMQRVMTAVPTEPPGVFAAPPATGTVVERSVSRGIAGGALTLPSLRLEFPSLELPHFITLGRGRSMRIDSAQAPMVNASSAITQTTGPAFHQQAMQTQAFQVSTQMMSQNIAVPQRLPAVNPQSAEVRAVDEIEKLKNNLVEKQKLLESKLQQVDTMLNQLQTQQVPIPQPQQWEMPPVHQFPLPCDQAPVDDRPFNEMLQDGPSCSAR